MSFRWVAGLVFAFVIFFVTNTPSVRAQANPTVTLNEDGTGTIDFGQQTNLTGTLQPDPGPGGLPLALTFTLSGQSSPGRQFGLEATPGDVFLFDSINPFTVSDVIRFNTDSMGDPSTVVFYSLPGGGDLADTGFPTQNYSNYIGLPEGNGTVTYTPGPGQPGYLPGVDVTATYVFNSPAEVPEPATVALISLGLAGTFLIRRRPA